MDKIVYNLHKARGVDQSSYVVAYRKDLGFVPSTPFFLQRLNQRNLVDASNFARTLHADVRRQFFEYSVEQLKEVVAETRQKKGLVRIDSRVIPPVARARINDIRLEGLSSAEDYEGVILSLSVNNLLNEFLRQQLSTRELEEKLGKMFGNPISQLELS